MTTKPSDNASTVGQVTMQKTAEVRTQVTDNSSKIDKTNFLRYLGSTIAAIIFIGAIFILHHELQNLRMGDIRAQMHNISGLRIFFAILLCAASYLALTNYDRLGILYVKRVLPLSKILSISFTAFAVGHNVGVATLSGGSVRYRAYSSAGLTAIEIAKIIGFCGLTFLLGASLLLSLALFFEPNTMLAHLPIPRSVLKCIAVVMLIFPIAYLLVSFFRKRSIRFWNWDIEWPSAKIALQQVGFACADLSLAAGVLYVLLPASLDISYFYLLGAYLIAVGLGAISSVPGGLGVIEGMLLLLLPEIPQATLLGAVLSYRVIYYLVPLSIALLLLTTQELRPHRQRVAKSLTTTGLWVGGVAPQILGATVFLAGAVLVFSGVFPRISHRLSMIDHLIPLPLLEASNILSSAIGVALLLVARGLYRRLQGAYLIALALLVLGIVVSLLKGLDYEEAVILTLAALFLWAARKEFYRPAALIDQRFTSGWLFSLALVIGGSIWIGFFQYQHIEYREEMWWQFALEGDAPRMLRASLVAVIVAIGFGLAQLMRPSELEPNVPNEADLNIVKTIIGQSSSASENVALMGDKRFLIHPSSQAFIMYQVSGRSWIALGDPVGDPQYHESLAWQFRELSDKHGARCVFYQVSDDHLTLYLDLGLSLSKLGEEGKVVLPSFSMEGKKRSDFRQAINRAERAGASFEIIPAENVPAIMQEIKAISDAWLQDKHASEKSFSLGAFDEKYLANFDIAVVKVNENIVAFANLWKSGDKKELSVDLMRYGAAAPKSIMDYLFTELMLWGKAENYQYFSLGMAPLSGLEDHNLATLWHKIGNLIFRFGDHFYNFEGLLSYKKKFDPIWEPRYLAAPGGFAMSAALIDSTTLISGGMKEVFLK